MARDDRGESATSQSLFFDSLWPRQGRAVILPPHICATAPPVMAQTPLILASSSPFRRQLLTRLGVAYSAESPDIDETPAPGETALALVRRLARDKAAHVAAQHDTALVIGADQVADLDDRIIGKPGDRGTAIEQLQEQSGRVVTFHTGLCLFAPDQSEPAVATDTVITRFRTLTRGEIERYVDSEDVTATAGSIKAEGLGITLLEAVESSDPTSLIGLPLIALRRMLADVGVALP